VLLASLDEQQAVAAAITGSDFLMDGGVTASYRFGDLASAATET
jgi:hypothetical protein